MKNLAKNFSTKKLAEIANGQYEDDDLIVILWEFYKSIVNEMVEDESWHKAWKSEGNLSRFHYSERTRRKVLERVDRLDDVLERRKLNETWSKGFDDNKGIYRYVKKVLEKAV